MFFFSNGSFAVAFFTTEYGFKRRVRHVHPGIQSFPSGWCEELIVPLIKVCEVKTFHF